MDKHWYKNAIIYGLDVKLFQDSNNNGFGDFKGLTSRLDYIKELGINCLWLMPFFPSPLKDYGYDVQDFLGIDPRLGNMDDFINLIEACNEKEIRVIIDLVINHTSTNHDWFVQAKSDKASKYRDYYLWKDEIEENETKKTMFEGNEGSIWEYVPQTNSYYLHTYFQEQADLNIANPAVRNEIFKIVKFWLNVGVCGFRIDAAHALTEAYPKEQHSMENFNSFLGEIREFANTINPEAVLLGEADVPPKLIQEYFGNGDRIDMLFNFLTNQYKFLAMAEHSALPLLKALKLSKKIKYGHFLNFVRHHDELNLQQLNDKERKVVLDSFAPHNDMRIYKNEGIKRELPTMLNNDMARIKLTYILIFSLPGSPMLHYGEELGMGDDLKRKDRFSIRIPMQWNEQLHGGFSSAPMQQLYCSPLFHGDYSYANINVEKQKKEQDSLYHFMAALIKTRKECLEIGEGKWTVTDVGNVKLLAIQYELYQQLLITICNLSSKNEKGKFPETVRSKSPFLEILSDSKYSKIDKEFTVNAYGYRWLKLSNHKII